MDIRRILVIDDDPHFGSALSDVLAPYGYTTATADGGAEGLTLAHSDPPFAAVLVDLVMPEVDGLAVIASLSAEQPELPLIVVTGTDNLADAMRAMREGAWDYVKKPIGDIDDLLAVLERVQKRAERIIGRARADEALRSSEERYRRIFENVAASIIMVDKDGLVVDINQFHLANFAGEVTRREDYLGRSVDAYSRVANAGLSEAYPRALAGEAFEKTNVHFAPTAKSPGGYFNIRGVPLRSGDRVTGAVFVHEDITNRVRAEQALEKKLTDQAALFSATRALLGQVSGVNAMATICRLAVDQFGMTMAWVGLVVDGTKRVRPASVHGFQDDYLADIDIRWDESPAGQCPTGVAIRTAKAVAMNRIATDPVYEPWRAAALDQGYQSSAALPLLDGTAVLGALNVYSTEPEFFSDDRIQLLQSFANLAAVSLRSARLYERDQLRLASLEEHVSERTSQLQDTNLQLQQEIAERVETEAALTESEERYRRLVEHNPFGIAVHYEGKVVDVNTTALQLLGATTADEILGRPAIQFWHPDFHELAQERIATIYENKGYASPLVERFVRLDGHTIDVEVSTIYSTYEGKPAVQTVFWDIRGREDKSRRYTQRLQILRDIYRAILAAESPGAIARAALGRIRQLVEFRWASVTLFDFETDMTIRRIAVVTDTDRAKSEREKQIPIDHFRGLGILRQRSDFVVDDVRAVLKPSPGEQKMVAQGIRSYANVPLHVGGQLIGSLNVESDQPGAFPASKIEILREVTGPLAVAIQQAGLYEQIQDHADEMEQRVADRTRELSALYTVTSIAIESLDIQVTLERSLKAVLENIESQSGAIQELDQTRTRLRLTTHCGLSKELAAELDNVPAAQGLAGIVIRSGEPAVLSSAQAAPEIPEAFAVAGLGSFIGVPVRAGGDIAAVLSVFGKREGHLTAEEIALLGAVADHIGVAIENARLRGGAERAAALEERERLAQDLHDSVTQSLYSLTLFARAAQEHAKQQNWGRLGDRLADIQESSVQALKEMRLLVHQLRPSALQQEGLAQALRKRLDAVEKRSGLDASLLVHGGTDLPKEIELSLYLLALEALNNALKHAKASKVSVTLRMAPTAVELIIEDDGTGFDLETRESRGGMGLANMRSRVFKMGGDITIRSSPEAGTAIAIEVNPAIARAG